MTRDTDRPRRGTDKPGAARPRSSRPGERPAFASGKPARGKGFGDKGFADKPSGKKPFEKKAFEKKTFGDRPVRSEKPKHHLRPAPAATAPSAHEQIATIALPDRQRIAKLMARVGLCSRRDAEAWIVDGRVILNGAVLTSPAMDVGPKDTILVDGIPLPAAEKTRLFLFHKPRGLVTSDHDPEGRETVADYLSENWPDGPRVVTIGRLDINTEGLLLLTNDGGLARILELPTTGWVRRYRVRAKGETDQGILDTLRAGIVVEGVDYAGIEAKLDRIQGANCWLTMGLREGKNREIKRVLEHLGLEVNRLIRLSYGPFQLLDLPEGKVEEVKTRVLRDQLGETLAAEAGVDFADSDAPIVGPPVSTSKVGTKTSRRAEGSRATGDRPPRAFAGKDRRRSERDEDDAPQPIRERPAAGTRRHVSTLRNEIKSDLQKGPRKRIERSDTTDRNDRKIAVERLVRGAPSEMPRARRGAGRLAPRDGEDSRKSGRSHASPSALAKRERIAKSGGAAPREREERDDRHGPAKTKVRSVRPQRGDGDTPFRARPQRADGDARRTSRAGDEKPWHSERPAAPERPRIGRSPKPDGFKGKGERSFGAKPGSRDGARPARPSRDASSDRPSRSGKPASRDPRTDKPSRPRTPKR